MIFLIVFWIIIFILTFTLKDFYFQYSVGELSQFKEHFEQRVVRVEGTVLRNMIPRVMKGESQKFIIIDSSKTALPIWSKREIAPLLKSGERVLVEGKFEGTSFIAQKVERIKGD